MKKLTLLVLFASLTSVFLNSCKGDDPEGPKPKPTVSWKTGGTYTSANANADAGTDIDFGVIAAPSDGENITRVRVTLSVNGGIDAVIFDSTGMKAKSFNRDWMDVPVGTLANAKNRFTVTVTQSNNESSSASFTVTVTPPVTPTKISTRSNIQMGAQANSTLGSFFDFDAQQVMLLSAANNNPSTVDFIYYYGANNKATFSAADDVDVDEVFPSVNNWSVKNASRFRRSTMTAAQFDALADGDPGTPIEQQASTGTFATRVTDLKVGDVIVFQTANAAQFGLIKVTALTVANNGSITFDLKIAD